MVYAIRISSQSYYLWPRYNIAVANKIGKELLRLLKKKSLLSNSLYKILNWNTIKLNYSTLTNVARLINKSKITKRRNNQPKFNCMNITNCPLTEKCQWDYIVHKVDVHSCWYNINNNV